MYFTDWRRLNRWELENQEEFSEPFCWNCAVRGHAVLADWRCQEGYNARFFCNSCVAGNMIFGTPHLVEKLIALCLAQEDRELQKLGDAFSYKETRTPKKDPFQRAFVPKPPGPDKPKRKRKPKAEKTFTGDKVLLTDSATGKPVGT